MQAAGDFCGSGALGQISLLVAAVSHLFAVSMFLHAFSLATEEDSAELYNLSEMNHTQFLTMANIFNFFSLLKSKIQYLFANNKHCTIL